MVDVFGSKEERFLYDASVKRRSIKIQLNLDADSLRVDRSIGVLIANEIKELESDRQQTDTQ